MDVDRMPGIPSSDRYPLDSVRVTRVQNPDIFSLPEFKSMFAEAKEANPIHPDPDAVADWCSKAVQDPEVEFMLAWSSGPFRCLGYFLTIYRTDLWAPTPWVMSVYSENREATSALAEAVSKATRARGFSSLRAMNQTGVSNEGYARIWRKWADVSVVAPVVDLDLKEHSDRDTQTPGGEPE